MLAFSPNFAANVEAAVDQAEKNPDPAWCKEIESMVYEAERAGAIHCTIASGYHARLRRAIEKVNNATLHPANR